MKIKNKKIFKFVHKAWAAVVYSAGQTTTILKIDS